MLFFQCSYLVLTAAGWREAGGQGERGEEVLDVVVRWRWRRRGARRRRGELQQLLLRLQVAQHLA